MNKKKITDYKYLLFDADGTLMDTTELIYQTYKWTFHRFANLEVPRRELVKEIGKPLPATLEKFLPGRTVAEMQKIHKEHVTYQFSIAGDYLRLFPDVQSALQGLRAKGKILVVVTSRSRETLVPYFRSLGILSCFQVLITPEDTGKHKPDPAPVLAALVQLKVQPADSLFIGDSIYDMQSAGAAGSGTCFVMWSDTDRGSLPFPPDFTINSILELLG